MKNPKAKESERVMRYRKERAKLGYRNLAFMASAEEHAEIERKCDDLGLTIKELLLYYIRDQHLRADGGYSDSWGDAPFPDCFPGTPEGLLASLEVDQQRGECFQLKAGRRQKKYQKYVIAEFLYVTPKKGDDKNYFPFELLCPNKGYATYEEAIWAYLTDKPKLNKNRQHMLLEKKVFEDPRWAPPENNWYIPVFTLKELYPQQLGPVLHPTEQTAFQEAYNRIKEEMNRS